MASTNVKTNCAVCGKDRATSKCGGCSQDICYNYLDDHRQKLTEGGCDQTLQSQSSSITHPLLTHYSNDSGTTLSNSRRQPGIYLMNEPDFSNRLENPSKPGDPTKIDTNNKVLRDCKSILNKVTPQTYDKVQKQLEALEIDRYERLEGMVNLLYSKAINEPAFSFLYARLCKQFQKKQVTAPCEDGKTVTHYFRQILLTRCQKEFENNYRQEIQYEKRHDEVKAITDEKKRNEQAEKLEEDLVKAKQRKLGNILFIGELFKLQMLTDTIMYDCIEYLIRDKTDEEALECLCRLLRTIGKELDGKANEKAMNKQNLEKHYQALDNIVQEHKTSARIRFMIQDLIELRQASRITLRVEAEPIVDDASLANEFAWLSDTPEPEPSTTQTKENHSPHADLQLVRLFKSVNDQGTAVNDSEIIKYIREHMNPNEKFYIRNIVLSYLEACLINRDPQKKIQEDIAKRRMTVLNAIIEHKPEAEIQAVYAIQNFVHKLEHPPKMAQLLFDIFYDEECVSEDAFLEWLKHPDQSETEGHTVVEMSTKDFFAWLQHNATSEEEN